MKWKGDLLKEKRGRIRLQPRRQEEWEKNRFSGRFPDSVFITSALAAIGIIGDQIPTLIFFPFPFKPDPGCRDQYSISMTLPILELTFKAVA